MTDGKKVKGFLEHFGQPSSDFVREYADEIPSCTKLTVHNYGDDKILMFRWIFISSSCIKIKLKFRTFY